MEQKIIKMPFDIELAKKITEKSVKGRIVTRDGRNARIACWNYKSLSGEYPLLVLIENGIFEDQELYTLNGKEKSFIKEACDGDLVIEVPEHLESACDNYPILSNSSKIGKKEDLARDYSKRVSNGRVVIQDYTACAYMAGWDACMEYLSGLPLDESMNEIMDNCEGKEVSNATGK